MNDSTIRKVAWLVVFLLILASIFVVGLLGWAFVEIIQWITAK